ncbi:unnamed protein product [Blepharisma stoltei]|uniref:P-type sodium-transporting ATPase4 n=1 Tax=Blepharisma stoltei TaxID=1481888 RepID=A0AAU9IDB7_9CILI|nr:unnamed protein product [Blepharisma stoltei]
MVDGRNRDATEFREIALNRGRNTNSNIFPNNFITTAKYTTLTLIPKNLFEQFHRVANIWFLIVSIFQILPFGLSPTSSWATIAPLSLVLTVTLIKDAYQDYRRRKSDKDLNNREVRIWKEEKEAFEPVKWMQLEVGNLVLLESDSPVPADIVIFATSHEEHICYIETSNLDGETNLKIRNSLPETSAIFEGELESAMKMIYKLDNAKLKSEHPNNRLYSFEGSLILKGHPKAVPIDNGHILLRGSTVKNSKWVLGCAVFTGIDTKLMMNSKMPPHKRSNVERRVNRYLTIVFTILLVISMLSASISAAYIFEYPDRTEFFTGKDDTSAAYLNFITFLILYNSLVPISLYVTMDVVRVIQAKFIQWDLRMYYEPIDRPAIAKTGDLNEDLGQIEYIFSDKTGTLTENQMEFKMCSIKGKIYGSMEQSNTDREDISINPHPQFKFYDSTLLEDLKGSRSKEISEFLELLSTCHTVIPDKGKDGELIYQAASPDEEALVIAAHALGYSFFKSKPGYLAVKIHNEVHEYKVVGVNEFNSNRKRMSVIIESLTEPSRPPILYCKGADNVILERANASEAEKNELNKQLYDYSVQGLRTLVLAKRELTRAESQDFERKWHAAKNAMADRQKRLDEVAAEIEVNMDIIGATAIEDKIQEGVPETIADLMEGGVKVWVLTGDKQETAINIGYSCKMLKKEMEVIIINAHSLESTKSQLKKALMKSVYKENESNPAHFMRVQEDEFEKEIDIESLNLGLVIDGETLLYVFSDMQAMEHFAMLSCLCHAVICCRVSPLQKSEVVKLVKCNFQFQPITLAIGDGANDVSMIQEAHVGIGICGKEGLQAVNSSDYAIARFKYLIPLLFLHGRWNYMRITMVILYSFYKNFILVLPMFYFSFMNMYSGTALYDSYLLLSFNVALTSLPIVIVGSIDRDLEADDMLINPALYQDGIYSRRFNAKIFIKWTFKAIFQSIIIYFLITMNSFNLISGDGDAESYNLMGTVYFYSIVLTVSFMIMIKTNNWTFLFIIVLFLSALAFFPFIFFYDYAMFPTSELTGVTFRLFSELPCFLSWTLIPPFCFIVILVKDFIYALWFPSEIDHIRSRKTGKVHPEMIYEQQEEETKHLIISRASKYKSKLSDVFNPKGIKLKNDKEEEAPKNDYSLKTLTLQFYNLYMEKSFNKFTTEKIMKFIRKIFIILFILNLIWTISDIVQGSTNSMIAIRIGVVIVFFGFIIFVHTRLFVRYYEPVVLAVLVVGLVIKVSLEIINQNDGSMTTALVPILTFVLFSVSTYKVFLINILFLMIYLIRVLVHYATDLDAVSMEIIAMNYIVLLSGITVISAFVGYALEKSRRTSYILRKKLEHQFQKGQEILGNLLPRFVKDRVKQGVRYIAEDQGIVTLLFCDIYDFDKICVTHTPNELIDLLDKFFAILDGLCDKHGVTKIETVNKTYLVCGGLKDSEENLSPELLDKNHAQRVLELAMNILKKIEPVYLKNGDKFQVKMGINSGPIIAGVVGDHKPQFSLIGDTINTASRMCSTLKEPCQIQISSATYEFVKSQPYNFKPSKVEAKGKGWLDTYVLKVQEAKKKNRRVTTFEEMGPTQFQPIEQQQQQQEPLPEKNSLNVSVLPLLPSEGESYAVKETSTVFDIDKLQYESFDSDEDYAGLAGPVQWLTCSFKEMAMQHEYRITTLKKEMATMRWGLWMTIIIYAIILANFIVGFELTSNFGNGVQIGLRAACLAAMIGLAIVLKNVYQNQMFPWAVMVIYISCSYVSVLSISRIRSDFFYIIVLEEMYTNVVINHISGLPFGHILIASFCDFIHWITAVILDPDDYSKSIEATFFIFIFTFINAAASYMREYNDRKNYNLSRMAQRDIQNTEKLLSQMMPPSVVKNLHNNVTTTDKYADVTMIYADIVGFTAYSSNKKPIEVVSMLSKLFSNFDHLCMKNNVYKVHTIGDCYVVLSFSDSGEDGYTRNIAREVTNMINMALDMIKCIKRINRDKNMSLNMRIGLHTGEVTAGITGTNIVRYDIYGPDVDIANKMESNGQAGKINVSEVTKALLEVHCPGRFDYVFNKVVTHQPVNRSLDAYFVRAKLTDDLEF